MKGRWVSMLLWGVLALGASFPALSRASAETFPQRPITMLFPFTTNQTEVVFRTIGQSMSKYLGQPVVLENRAGAAGRVTMSAILNKRGDPYTIAVATTSMLLLGPLTSLDFQYEPGVDYAPITRGDDKNLVFIASKGMPFTDMKGLIDYAKAHPGELNVGIVGHGSTQHLASAMLETMAGIKVELISYKGEAEILQALMADQIHLSPASPGSIPFIQDGRVNALATTGSTRSAKLPDVPTVAETLDGYMINTWTSLIAPAGVPAEAVAQIRDAYAKAVAEPALKDLLASIELTDRSDTPQEFSEQLKAEGDLLKTVYESLNVGKKQN